MRLVALLFATWVLVSTAVITFSREWSKVEWERDNAVDHTTMNRELSAHGAKIDSLEVRLEALAGLPERVARIESTMTEKLDAMAMILKGLLVSVLILVVESVRVWVKEAKERNGKEKRIR